MDCFYFQLGKADNTLHSNLAAMTPKQKHNLILHVYYSQIIFVTKFVITCINQYVSFLNSILILRYYFFLIIEGGMVAYNY